MTPVSSSPFIASMDKHTPKCFGEKGHLQHDWSHKLQERIVQLSFQLVRTNKSGVEQLAGTLNQILFEIKGHSAEDSSLYLDTIRRMILSTRDLEDGKGEWALGYALLRTYYDHYPEEAMKMVKYFVSDLPLDGKQAHPYGSWKDIKYLWAAFGGVSAPLVFSEFIIKLSNDQIRKDATSERPSLAARWLPREKGAAKSSTPYKPLFEALAKDYFAHYLATAKTPESKVKAERKAFTDYRKLLARINKVLDTTQIKQCANQYSEIDYSHVTSVTLRNQTRAFQNKKGKKGDEQRSNSDDRIAGAANFSSFVEKAKRGEGPAIKGKRVGLNKMIADMRELVRLNNHKGEQGTVADLQWEDAGKKIGALDNFVPMVDLSGSMVGDPINAAIGLGLRVAEKSRLGRRILTFSNDPKWMNLEGTKTLSDMISYMAPYERSGHWGMSTNFTAALRLVLNVCVENKLAAEHVENMVLAIFSDMQIDAAGNESLTDTMWRHIEKEYARAGRAAIGVPYKPPHILFWNLRHTNGFPVLSEQKGATMFSGFSPALLNTFMEVGMEAIKDCTPWNMLRKQLDNPRYNLSVFA